MPILDTSRVVASTMRWAATLKGFSFFFLIELGPGLDLWRYFWKTLISLATIREGEEELALPHPRNRPPTGRDNRGRALAY